MVSLNMLLCTKCDSMFVGSVLIMGVGYADNNYVSDDLIWIKVLKLNHSFIGICLLNFDVLCIFFETLWITQHIFGCIYQW